MLVSLTLIKVFFFEHTRIMLMLKSKTNWSFDQTLPVLLLKTKIQLSNWICCFENEITNTINPTTITIVVTFKKLTTTVKYIFLHAQTFNIKFNMRKKMMVMLAQWKLTISTAKRIMLLSLTLKSKEKIHTCALIPVALPMTRLMGAMCYYLHQNLLMQHII